jgi:hypothetical protein
MAHLKERLFRVIQRTIFLMQSHGPVKNPKTWSNRGNSVASIAAGKNFRT